MATGTAVTPRRATPIVQARPCRRARSPRGQVWRRLLQLVRPWWWETALVFALGPLHALSQVALGVVSALLVAQVFIGGDLVPWLWALALLVPATALLRWLDSWVSHDLAYRLLAELRIRLYGCSIRWRRPTWCAAARATWSAPCSATSS